MNILLFGAHFPSCRDNRVGDSSLLDWSFKPSYKGAQSLECSSVKGALSSPSLLNAAVYIAIESGCVTLSR